LDAPSLQNYRNQNAATGGYGAFNTAAPGAAANAANSENNWLTTLATGANRLINPPSSLEELLKKFGSGGGYSTEPV